MSTSLALIQPEELDTIQRTGKLLAASGYFDGKGESVQAIAMMATKILAGREIGIGPFAAVNGIHIIKGKPSIGANLLASAVKGSGRYDYRIREINEKICRIEFFQKAGDKWESLGVSEFTAEEASRAQTQNMDKFPKNMLFARAMSNGVRFYVPDVFNGNAVYVPEELGAEVNENGDIITVDARSVDTSTGEIIEASSGIPATVIEWLNQAKPGDAAKEWAVEIGVQPNVHAAGASMKKITDSRFGGKYTPENREQILVAFYEYQLDKKKKALEAVTVADAEPLPAF